MEKFIIKLLAYIAAILIVAVICIALLILSPFVLIQYIYTKGRGILFEIATITNGNYY